MDGEAFRHNLLKFNLEILIKFFFGKRYYMENAFLVSVKTQCINWAKGFILISSLSVSINAKTICISGS